MKKTFIAAFLMVAVTLMTFAGGFNFGPKGEMAEGATEVIQLEKEYQLVSLLNYTGFSKAQLEEIITVVEKTQGDIAKIKEDVTEELADAVELAKNGETTEATEKHDAAIAKKKELATIKDEFTSAIKGLITVEQQEKMMQYAMQTAMKGMRQGRDFADKMSMGRTNQMQNTSAVQGRNGETARPSMENLKNTVKNSERYQKLPEQMKEKVEEFVGKMQKGQEGRNPMQMMQTMKKAAPNMNPATMFFGSLLMGDNLEIVKEYATGLTE